MDDTTIARLNALNRTFYEIIAADFDQTRAAPWPGWDALLPHLAAPLSVLDVACGNGRFGLFLFEHLGTNVTYHGVDSNPALLSRARAALAGHNTRLELCDVLTGPLPQGAYDLVALFGMLHHIPGYEGRRRFLRSLVGRVAPGGLLIFAAWRFYEHERFRQRILPWPLDLVAEPGDYLLDWRRGARAPRYCHYVDDAEHAALVAATGLRELATYRADGHTGDVNRYSILRRDSP
ncbi:MAG: class I SAM-dependent methyltransferase [Anaerolineae bacterium]|nr:class I SAM-dependent methyltransferase [Anaerolineae bacterium]